MRYVYQPIENLFLLLVTNKASNIVEDLETLRMLSKGQSSVHLAALGGGKLRTPAIKKRKANVEYREKRL